MDQQLPEWMFSTMKNGSSLKAENIDELLNNNKTLNTILDSIQDGISILTPALDIVYLNSAMKSWYGIIDQVPYIKCHKLFHNSKRPCEGCPSLQTLVSHEPASYTVPYKIKKDISGYRKVFTSPILNRNGDIAFIIEYVRDVSFEMQITQQMTLLQQHLELLEKQNSLLIKNLAAKEKQFEDLTDTVTENIENYVRPSLEYLKGTVKSKDVDLVSSVVEQVVYPLTKKRSSKITTLSARELQVASLIKEGYSSKQIADKLIISKKSVDFHRSNIRKKLDLDPGVNLVGYLKMNL